MAYTFRMNCVNFGKCYYAYFLLSKSRLMCSKSNLKFLKKVESAFQIFDHSKCRDGCGEDRTRHAHRGARCE